MTEHLLELRDESHCRDRVEAIFANRRRGIDTRDVDLQLVRDPPPKPCLDRRSRLRALAGQHLDVVDPLAGRGYDVEPSIEEKGPRRAALHLAARRSRDRI